MNPDLISLWKTPTPAFRGKPFWSWNGVLEPDELKRQAHVFKQMGMGGYFMHARTGLETRYLGKEWFECINAGADEAEHLGMEAWLYDEDRWPSGSAGGLATTQSRFRAKYLRLKIHRPQDTAKPHTAPLWPDEQHFVAAFSALLAEETLVDAYKAVPFGGAALKPEHSLLVFSWEEAEEHSFYNDQTYLDTMCAQATEHYLCITHDAYAKACGERIGNSIKGVFTDEPNRGFVFCDLHGQPGAKGDTAMVTPWTPQLWAAFETAFGYDLRGRLPELFLRPSPQERLSPVKWQYMEVCQRLFMENWAKPMQERCRKLGLQLTGHALHEDSLTAQAVPCGSVLRYYEHFDCPGVDVLGLRNTNFHVVKQLSSVSRQFGKQWMMSEMYGCSGWQTTFEDHKRIGDWQALFGINLRCHHLSWYSMAGESKRDYPASISFQSAWWREYEAVETYFSRLHVLMQAGSPLCDVLVIHPEESLWAQIRVGWATWLQATDPDVLALEKIYTDVFAWLCHAQVDFDYGDEEHLARRADIDAKTGSLVLGPMRYRVIVVAGIETLRSSSVELLRRFLRAGGRVVFAGDVPPYVDAMPSDAVRNLSCEAVQVALNREALVQAVRDGSPASRTITLDSHAEGLFCQVRQLEGSHLVALLNPSETRDCATTQITLEGAGPVVELDCLSGEMRQIEFSETNGRLRWEASFHPLQERIYLCGTDIADALPRLPTQPALANWQALDAPDGYDYELDEPNTAVLDMASLSIAGSHAEWEPRQEILRIEKRLCEHTGMVPRGGTMVQPWASAPKVPAVAVPVRLRFDFEVKHMPEGDIRLMLEQPERYRISLNGMPVQVPEQTGWRIDPCLRTLPLPTEYLRPGSNELILQTTFEPGLNLEAVYLSGDFGVETSGSTVTLTPLPKKLQGGDWTTQGLPFYSGRIALRIRVGNARRLRLKPVGVATVVLRHPSGSTHRILPWKPFEADLSGFADDQGIVIAECVLTRRNTFGPLHLAPADQGNIGPDSFRSEGVHWSDTYQFIATGLECEVSP